MSIDLSVNINKVVTDMCNQLLVEQQLITTKSLIIKLNELHPNISSCCSEELIASEINSWRIANLKENLGKNIIEHEDIYDSSENTIIQHKDSQYKTTKINWMNKLNKPEYKSELQSEHIYKKKLIRAKREIQILKAKIQALQSFYDRQRKELVMRIEGMLYQK